MANEATVLVPLTRGYIAIIDASDYPLVSQFKWRANINRNMVYARTSGSGPDRKSSIPMHRLILNAPSGAVVDHIDRDGLNNRRSNLRLATPGENTMNTPARGKWGYKGVSYDPRCKLRPWQALARVDGRQRSFGFYETPEQAARAYDEAAKELWGEFAYLNFPAALEGRSDG